MAGRGCGRRRRAVPASLRRGAPLPRRKGRPIDDLIQRTFLKAAESVGRLRNAASFRAYLLSIARNELFQEYRRRGRRPVTDDDVAHSKLVDLMPSPSRVAADREEHRLLLRGLRRIPLDSQIALELHYWEGMTTAELADVLGVPHGTAKGRLQRARSQLREVVESLEASPALVQSTLGGLSTWAAELRQRAIERR